MDNFNYSTGGRTAPSGNDCVVRATCIVSGLDYDTVYSKMDAENRKYQRKVGRKRISSILKGGTYRPASNIVLKEIGFERIGKYSRPVSISRARLDHGDTFLAFTRGHAIAIVDGRVHDTWDSSRKRVKEVWVYRPEGAVVKRETLEVAVVREVPEPKKGKMWGQFVIVEELPGGEMRLADWHPDFETVYEHRRRAEKVVWKWRKFEGNKKLRVIKLERAEKMGLCHVTEDTGTLVPGRLLKASSYAF